MQNSSSELLAKLIAICVAMRAKSRLAYIHVRRVPSGCRRKARAWERASEKDRPASDGIERPSWIGSLVSAPRPRRSRRTTRGKGFFHPAHKRRVVPDPVTGYPAATRDRGSRFPDLTAMSRLLLRRRTRNCRLTSFQRFSPEIVRTLNNVHSIQWIT